MFYITWCSISLNNLSSLFTGNKWLPNSISDHIFSHLSFWRSHVDVTGVIAHACILFHPITFIVAIFLLIILCDIITAKSKEYNDRAYKKGNSDVHQDQVGLAWLNIHWNVVSNSSKVESCNICSVKLVDCYEIAVVKLALIKVLLNEAMQIQIVHFIFYNNL